MAWMILESQGLGTETNPTRGVVYVKPFILANVPPVLFFLQYRLTLRYTPSILTIYSAVCYY